MLPHSPTLPLGRAAPVRPGEPGRSVRLGFEVQHQVPFPLERPAPAEGDRVAEERAVEGEGVELAALAGTLRIENVLDRKYRDIANLPGRGRVVFVGARLGLGD